MTGRPQREHPKVELHAHIDQVAYERARALYHSAGDSFASFSSFVETIIFLVEEEYARDAGSELLSELCALEEWRFATIVDLQTLPPQRTIHVTLDPAAKDFLDMLSRRHRPPFLNRSIVLTDMLLYIAERARKPEQAAALLELLEDVRASHPTRPPCRRRQAKALSPYPSFAPESAPPRSR